MRRQIRLQANFVVEIDDDRDGIPFVGDVDAVLERIARVALPGATRILPGGRLEVGLTRASLVEARRRWRSGADRADKPRTEG